MPPSRSNWTKGALLLAWVTAACVNDGLDPTESRAPPLSAQKA
jgi:hypothetical protein